MDFYTMKLLEMAISSLIDGNETMAKKHLHSWYVGVARKINESLNDETDFVISNHDQRTVEKAKKRIDNDIWQEEEMGEASNSYEANGDYIRALEDLKFNLPETSEEMKKVKHDIENIVFNDWNFDRKVVEKLFIDLSYILGLELTEDEDLDSEFDEPEEFDSDKAQEEIDAEEYYGE